MSVHYKNEKQTKAKWMRIFPTASHFQIEQAKFFFFFFKKSFVVHWNCSAHKKKKLKQRGYFEVNKSTLNAPAPHFRSLASNRRKKGIWTLICDLWIGCNYCSCRLREQIRNNKMGTSPLLFKRGRGGVPKVL